MSDCPLLCTCAAFPMARVKWRADGDGLTGLPIMASPGVYQGYLLSPSVSLAASLDETRALFHPGETPETVMSPAERTDCRSIG
jgi:hypothetical protein